VLQETFGTSVKKQCHGGGMATDSSRGSQWGKRKTKGKELRSCRRRREPFEEGSKATTSPSGHLWGKKGICATYRNAFTVSKLKHRGKEKERKKSRQRSKGGSRLLLTNGKKGLINQGQRKMNYRNILKPKGKGKRKRDV